MRDGHLIDAAGAVREISEILLLDIMAAEGFADPRLRTLTGDICDAALLREVIGADTASIFHLAAVVSGQAEADFDLGMRDNLDASRLLLERCRQLGTRPKVVFTSSVAVYGGDMPALVGDATALEPQSSYGVQKAIGELLLSDCHRRGFIDGRVLRLPTVSVRPGKPNKAASSFASGIVREPLAGIDAVCPVSPETRLWLLSPRRAISSLVAGHELASEALGRRRCLNLPGISVTAGEMVDTLKRVAGAEVTRRVHWEPDPTVQRIVGGWPAAWDTTRATSLGLAGDADFQGILQAYIEDDLPARHKAA